MHLIKRAAHGAEAGFLAGAAVAACFLVLDAVRLQPFATPLALVGSVWGPATPSYDGNFVGQAVTISILGARLVEYTLLHQLAFSALGVVAAFALNPRSFWPCLWGGMAFGAVACTGVLAMGQWVLGAPLLLEGIGLWNAVLINAAAGVVLGVGVHLAEVDLSEETSG